jgi:undecaprenyl phosphate-alpha-L-ara4FN deformylase
MTKTVGLRIDVDTLRGTRRGVPALCELLRRHNITATFYFSVGPDNMGRNLWRLLRPAFLKKMLRSDAAGLYGWDILLMGTAWPGPRIGARCEKMIRDCVADGHEIGLHAWDHQKWQSRIDRMTQAAQQNQIIKGCRELQLITGTLPQTSAVPGWRCNNDTLLAKEEFNFTYNSDCRGQSTFYPVVNDTPLTTPQIPVTLPTYDEIIGQNGITHDNYNQHILSLVREDQLNVLTIHTEVEGISCHTLFDRFLDQAEQQSIQFRPLSDLLTPFPPQQNLRILQQEFPGREGWIACQENTP